MKNCFKLLPVVILLSACSSVKQIGKVNMISNRNVDSKLEYQAIQTYSGGSEKELKHSRAETIEEAIDNTVKNVPGGEFMMNAKIYLIKGKYIAVEGDVWGIPQQMHRGLAIGDRVTWKEKVNIIEKQFVFGTITALGKTVLVKSETSDKLIELQYEDVSKAGN